MKGLEVRHAAKGIWGAPADGSSGLEVRQAAKRI